MAQLCGLPAGQVHLHHAKCHRALSQPEAWASCLVPLVPGALPPGTRLPVLGDVLGWRSLMRTSERPSLCFIAAAKEPSDGNNPVLAGSLCYGLLCLPAR